MSLAHDAVVRREIVVDAPIDRAFAVFVERFGDFKPREHNLLGAEIAETRFEPRVGGHIYDRAVDGSECRWARVLAYEPPHRVVFSWDISPSWQLEADETNASEVEVRFVATYQDDEPWEALGDRTRRAIVLRLAERPQAVGELAAGLPVSRPAVSQHLRVLKAAGVVSEQAVGTRRIYRLNETGVAALRDQLDTFWNRALSGYQDIAEQPPKEKP